MHWNVFWIERVMSQFPNNKRPNPNNGLLLFGPRKNSTSFGNWTSIHIRQDAISLQNECKCSSAHPFTSSRSSKRHVIIEKLKPRMSFIVSSHPASNFDYREDENRMINEV